jgi:outer membrane murein-binding lipoprotein Lpp
MMKRLVSLGLIALLALPVATLAASPEEAAIQQLQQQIQKLSAELEALAKKVEESKQAAPAAPSVVAPAPAPAAAPAMSEIKELAKRLDKVEKHSVLDRIEFSGDMRVKADSLHYDNVTLVQPPMADTNGDGFMDPNMNSDGTYRRSKYSLNNDVLYTTRLRLNMKAKVWDNVKFNGRLTMYKNWGDSTGVKEFDGWNTYTMDGTSSGNTTDDYIHVERAFFDWSDIGGTPAFFSVGRRPSTYGPPTHIRENELRGGTVPGNLMFLNFDGATLGYKLEDQTGIPGMVARFCYGQGYESEWGNGELFNEVDVEDTHFAGFNVDVYNDDKNYFQVTAFHAWDLTDGFKGLLAVPASFGGSPMPGFNVVSRYSATTNIGDMNLAGAVFTREEDNGFKWFGSFGWTQTDPNGDAGMFGGLLSDSEMAPVFKDPNNPNPAEIVGFESTGKALEDETRDGYGVYVGMQTPAPLGKFGLEYNYGSKYWTPFTQAQDDVVGSKLATRGHAGEAYYIFDINPNMFLKVGAIYYDYEYTGSGTPVGKPQKIKDVQDGKAYSILPAVDEVWDLYASMTLKF